MGATDVDSDDGNDAVATTDDDDDEAGPWIDVDGVDSPTSNSDAGATVEK